jgi:Protein of unknown function (DUF3500)
MTTGADPPGLTPAARVAGRMAEAAREFLYSLDPAQRRVAEWPFPSDEERLRWYYTPTDHGGLPLSQMRPSQQQLALRLLATGLSRPAHVTACVIIGLENILDELEGWTITWGRERGRDPGLYYLRVFGTPGGRAPWSWRFGGHHVSVHHLVVDGAVQASTPLFLGADPATSPLLGGYELRPLGSAEDLGRELVTALDAEDRRLAVISPVPPFDLVSANRSRIAGGELPLPLAGVWRERFQGELGEFVEGMQRRLEAGLQITQEHLDAVRLTSDAKGIPASRLSLSERDLLRDVVAVHLARLPEELAKAEMEKYAGEQIEALSFAWAGGIERGVPHYYRVQSRRLLIEYDNAQRAGNHAHSVWRDPEGDFGADVLGDHHRRGRGSGETAS